VIRPRKPSEIALSSRRSPFACHLEFSNRFEQARRSCVPIVPAGHQIAGAAPAARLLDGRLAGGLIGCNTAGRPRSRDRKPVSNFSRGTEAGSSRSGNIVPSTQHSLQKTGVQVREKVCDIVLEPFPGHPLVLGRVSVCGRVPFVSSALRLPATLPFTLSPIIVSLLVLVLSVALASGDVRSLLVPSRFFSNPNQDNRADPSAEAHNLDRSPVRITSPEAEQFAQERHRIHRVSIPRHFFPSIILLLSYEQLSPS